MKRLSATLIIASVLLLSLLAGCGGGGGSSNGGGTFTTSSSPQDPALQVPGTVKRVGIEGGFYGIKGDDGTQYEPTNLPADFKNDGERVRFNFKPVNVASAHQWGQTVEITAISAQ
jgi:hypothetical protein